MRPEPPTSGDARSYTRACDSETAAGIQTVRARTDIRLFFVICVESHFRARGCALS